MATDPRPFPQDRSASLSVLLADGQPLMRIAVRITLRDEGDIDVVGEAPDGLAAIALTEKLDPDVVVMDVHLPGLDGIEATRQLTAPTRRSPAKVLILTGSDSDECVIEALRAGAKGFLLKDTPAEELTRAIRVVAAGDAVIAPSVTRRLLDQFASRLPPVHDRRPEALASLTERELTVLRMVAQGRSNGEIADALFVAETTVKCHVGRILAKLGLHDRVHLVVLAYENGLVHPGSL